MAEETAWVRLFQTGPIPLDLSLELVSGQVHALVGPSGSGKTTILRSIAGLHRPDSGRIEVGGDVWFDSERSLHRPPETRSIGLVFQSFALFPHMTASGNIEAALGHLPRNQRRARANEYLERVHLGGLGNRRPAQLSGGQQQRVAVARALARNPRILLLDEPFSAVDQVTRQRLYRELADLRQTLAMPVLFVTHDLREAMMLADRMTVIHRGRSLQTGPPMELVRRPADVTVARLLGHRNIFHGVAARDPATDAPRIAWNGLLLEIAPGDNDGRTRLAEPGRPISWLVPQSSVLLHRRDRPSLGERENPVNGRIEGLTMLGDEAHITLDVGAAQPIVFMIGAHAARRNDLRTGADARISLLADSLHIMEAASS